MWYDDYVIMLQNVDQKQERQPRTVVTAQLWNTMFNVNFDQGNHSEEYINNLNDYLFKVTNKAAYWDAKQDRLIGVGEGQNIKTINNQSVVGSGNLTISSQGVASESVEDVGLLADPGTADAYSRGDHVHAISGDTIVQAIGDDTYYPRHGNPDEYWSKSDFAYVPLDPQEENYHLPGTWDGHVYTRLSAHGTSVVDNDVMILPSGMDVLHNSRSSDTINLGHNWQQYKAYLVLCCVTSSSTTSILSPVIIPAYRCSSASGSTDCGFLAGSTPADRRNKYIASDDEVYVVLKAYYAGAGEAQQGYIAIHDASSSGIGRIVAVLGIY